MRLGVLRSGARVRTASIKYCRCCEIEVPNAVRECPVCGMWAYEARAHEILYLLALLAILFTTFIVGDLLALARRAIGHVQITMRSGARGYDHA